MKLFRVYLNTENGRKSLECCAGSPGEASAKGRKLYENSIVVKVKAISAYTLPVPDDMTQEAPPFVRVAHADPNLQQISKRTPEGTAIIEAYMEHLGVREALSKLDFTDTEMRLMALDGTDVYRME